VTGEGFVVGGTHQTIPKIFFTSLHVRRMCNQVWLEIPFILMWSPLYKYNAIRAPTGSGLCVIRKEASICLVIVDECICLPNESDHVHFTSPCDRRSLANLASNCSHLLVETVGPFWVQTSFVMEYFSLTRCCLLINLTSEPPHISP